MCVALPGCAYGYAAREGRRAPAREQTSPTPTAKSPEAGESPAADEGDSEFQAEAFPDDRCADLIFEVHYYDDDARLLRRVACESGEVVRVQRSPMTGSVLETLRQTRHPAQMWYVLVDPEGVRTRYLSNPQLRELQSRYTLELVGRDPVDDVLIYQLEGEGF
ncbi:hypothetical protein [Lujinxingia litoralis]|uniref:hypothetical protein n=1 Tax=Lujinxingia litoralis TaxID=2211119 RepID=UPI0013146706|nr:hypothetical protein [Lujinxingia litoralis]